MRRFAALGLLALLWPSLAAARPLELNVYGGYRLDQLTWSIADPAHGIDILSELSWRKLSVATVGAELRYQPAPRLMLLGQVDYGYADSGRAQDSDYRQAGRTGEFSRSIGSGAGSELYGVMAGIGVPFTGEAGRWQVQLLPMVGLSYQRQDLRYRQGWQVITAPGAAPLGAIHGLDSRYTAAWSGAWGGLELALKDRRGTGVRLRIEHHLPRYSAKADWNLRRDFAHPVSFRQWARARGTTLAAEARYAYSRGYLSAQISQRTWKTSAGTDRVYFADGSTGSTHFNGADWDSTQVRVGIGFEF